MPCVPSFSIIKPNFCSATLYCGVRIKISKTLGMRPNAVSASPDYRTYSGKITCQTYMFWVCMSVFQQLLPSTHQALTFYHKRLKMSIVFFFFSFFRLFFLIFYKMFTFCRSAFILSVAEANASEIFIIFPMRRYVIRIPSYPRGICLPELSNKTDIYRRFRHSEPS